MMSEGSNQRGMCQAQFDDINVRGAKFSEINLPNVEFMNDNHDSMKMRRILVPELLAAH